MPRRSPRAISNALLHSYIITRQKRLVRHTFRERARSPLLCDDRTRADHPGIVSNHMRPRHIPTLQERTRLNRACFARAESMWSRKPMPVLTAASPVPSSVSSTEMLVSLVSRENLPVRGAAADIARRESARSALVRIGRQRGKRRRDCDSPFIYCTQQQTTRNQIMSGGRASTRSDRSN